jgi:hypothetical protein
MKSFENSIKLCGLLLVLALVSCKRPANEQLQTETEVAKQDTTAFSLDSFTEFPSEVMGCSCYFGLDSASFAQGQYEFVSDFGETAFVSINGEMTKFTRISREEVDSVTTKSRYENLDFWLTIQLIDGRALDYEVSRMTGKMTLGNKSGKEISVDLFGVCGC